MTSNRFGALAWRRPLLRKDGKEHLWWGGMDSATSSTNGLPAGFRVGEYSLLDVIGEGGFGIVYRAKDLSLNREVAIKEYMPVTLARRQNSSQIHVRPQRRGAYDAGLRGFINEARLLARFSHPALVHVYRFFEAGDTAYMVMRYYEGQTLSRLLEASSGRLDQARLCALLAPLLDALEVLHAEDCYHRDISPDNIFVQRDGSPVLLDFGAARLVIDDMTQAMTMMLKPGFAPVEQYADDGIMPQGAWTDIYQIGALIYQAVTGKVPVSSVTRMISDPMQPLTSKQAPGYSDVFLNGMNKALAVLPQNRPQSIAELRCLLDLDPNVQPAQSLPDVNANPAPLPGQTSAQVHAPQSMTGIDAQSAAPQATPDPFQPVPAPGADPFSTVSAAATSPPTAAASTANSTNQSNGLQATLRNWRTRPSIPIVIGACVAIVALVVAGIVLWNGSWEKQAHANALVARDNLAWQQAQNQSDVIRVQDYLDKFPEGLHRTEAQALLAQLHSASTSASTVPPPSAQSAPVPPVAVASSPPPASPVEPPKPEEPPAKVAAAATGKVVFRIVPWGLVSVNHAAAKPSPPLTQMDLPEGSYQIEISNPGVSTTVTKTIQITKGQSVTVSQSF